MICIHLPGNMSKLDILWIYLPCNLDNVLIIKRENIAIYPETNNHVYLGHIKVLTAGDQRY